MALIWKDRVLETSTTTGTGDFTLAGAVAGFRTFASVCATSDTAYYYIEAVDSSGVPTGDWETGLGTYSAANTLTRTTVLDSSNAGAAVSFAAGTKRVAIAAVANGAHGYRLIERYVANGSTGTKTFSSIPGIYRALALEWVGRSDQAATTDNLDMTFNGDTGSNYDRQWNRVSGTTASISQQLGATSVILGTLSAASAPSGEVGTGRVELPGYAGTTFRKSFTGIGDYKTADTAGGFSNMVMAGRWRSTAAISSITITLSSGNFVAGSVIELWGH